MANEPEIYEKDYDFKLSKNVIIKKGKDAAVFSTGSIINEVIQACVRLEKLGISVEIINVHTIKPFDRENLIYEASNHKYLFSIEEHSIIGGLGGLISEILIEENIMTKFKRIGLVDCFAKGYGTQQEVRKMNSLDADSIYSIIEKAVK
jgi:transketolase